MEVMVATLMEFHNQSNTGNGGGVTEPSACTTSKPRAACQCSHETCFGIKSPNAKLPGRRDMPITINNGKTIKQMNAIRRICVTNKR